MKTFPVAAISLAIALISPTRHGVAADKDVAKSRGGIQWFATLDAGLKAAKQTGRPILFLSAAPHCGGVSGVW